jgi:peptidoglycan DL-endopeptidase CwlO
VSRSVVWCLAGILGIAMLPARAVAEPLDRPAGLSARPSAADLERRIRSASHRLEILVEAYNGTRDELRDTRARSHALDGALAPLADRVRQRQAVIGGLAAALYRRAGAGPNIALLSARSPRQFMDGLLRAHRLDTEHRRAAADLASSRERVATTRLSLAALAAQYRRQQARLAVQKATVEGEIAMLRRLRIRAYGRVDRPSGHEVSDVVPPPYVAGPAGQAVRFAFRQLGKPYRWGRSGPDAYDCSGLTSAAWASAGVPLPHNSGRQYGAVGRIRRADLRPGDLVFYYGRISHVGIYVGGGKIVHAPEYGESIRFDDVDYQPVHGFGRPR